jgi:hypothetical protein
MSGFVTEGMKIHLTLTEGMKIHLTLSSAEAVVLLI